MSAVAENVGMKGRFCAKIRLCPEKSSIFASRKRHNFIPVGRAFEFRKERKFKRWGQMAANFTKIGKEITLAAKNGGPDPNQNPRLRAAIQKAKGANMPKDRVEAAIKRVTDKSLADYSEVLYEGYGPGGIAMMIETATDNPTRTVANLRMYFNRAGGALGTSGSVGFMFEHKSVFTIGVQGLDPEELEFELIDAGLEEMDVDAEEGIALLTAAFESYGSMLKALEDKGITPQSSEVQWIPTTTTDLGGEAAEEMNKLLEKLEEDDDVQHVFHNMREI